MAWRRPGVGSPDWSLAVGSGLVHIDDMSVPRPLTRLRRLCLALPEAHEVEAWGEPTFRVRNKLFAMFASAGNHHGYGRHSVWCKCTSTNQQLLIKAESDRYFSPPYVGKSGWVGVYLDASPDWAAVQELLRDGYLLTAPARLRTRLGEPK
jgi:predicted DNA-binding protein (MmcQ/YjbR family)